VEWESRFSPNAEAVGRCCRAVGVGLVHMVLPSLTGSSLEFLFLATRRQELSKIRDDLVSYCLRSNFIECLTEFISNRFSFIFPNTALVTATQAIGKAFGSRPLQIVGTILAGILVFVWILVFVAMVRALILQRLLWPEDETDDENSSMPAAIENDEKV
jgi:hypothetical protein